MEVKINGENYKVNIELEKIDTEPISPTTVPIQWVSCEERLPDCTGNYLVTRQQSSGYRIVECHHLYPQDASNIGVMYQDEHGNCAEIDAMQWCSYNGFIAWAELPKGYQVDEEA